MTVYDIIKELGITEGWSPLFGNCYIDLDNTGSIWIRGDFSPWVILDKSGKYAENGECVIFPSKDDRDWEKVLKKKKRTIAS